MGGIYQAIGLRTGRVYTASRYRSECFRVLSEKYPTLDYEGYYSRAGSENVVYPEPLVVVKLTKEREF